MAIICFESKKKNMLKILLKRTNYELKDVQYQMNFIFLLNWCLENS